MARNNTPCVPSITPNLGLVGEVRVHVPMKFINGQNSGISAVIHPAGMAVCTYQGKFYGISHQASPP